MTDRLTRLHSKEIINFYDYIEGAYTSVDDLAADVEGKFMHAVRNAVALGVEHMKSKGLVLQTIIIDNDYDFEGNSELAISFYRDETPSEQEKREREEMRVAEQRLRQREGQDAQDRALYERLKKKYG